MSGCRREAARNSRGTARCWRRSFSLLKLDEGRDTAQSHEGLYMECENKKRLACSTHLDRARKGRRRTDRECDKEWFLFFVAVMGWDQELLLYRIIEYSLPSAEPLTLPFFSFYCCHSPTSWEPWTLAISEKKKAIWECGIFTLSGYLQNDISYSLIGWLVPWNHMGLESNNHADDEKVVSNRLTLRWWRLMQAFT